MILSDIELVKIERPGRQFIPFTSKASTRRDLLKSAYMKFLRDSQKGITYTPIELSKTFEELLRLDTEIKKHTKATVKLNGWKGKSTIEIINMPNSFKVITYQREDQDSIYKPIESIITKEELNLVIASINLLNKTDISLSTKEIAEQFCKLKNLKYNRMDKDMFPDNQFNFQAFFADRALHLHLNLCLRILDNYEVIKYRGGKTKVLRKVMDIQTEL